MVICMQQGAYGIGGGTYSADMAIAIPLLTVVWLIM